MSKFVHFRLAFSARRYSMSETHYLTGNFETSSPQAAALALAYANRRIMLLGVGCYLDSIELADDANPQSTVYVAGNGLRPGEQSAPAVPLRPIQFGQHILSSPPQTTDPQQEEPIQNLISDKVNSRGGSGSAIGYRFQAPIGATTTALVNTLALQQQFGAQVGAAQAAVQSTGSLKFPTPPPGFAYNPAFISETFSPGSTADLPYSSLMVRKEAAVSPVNYHAQLYLTGNPDVIQRSDLVVPDDAVWLSAWDRLIAGLQLGASPYGMKVIDRSGAQSQPVPVLGVTVDQNNRFVYVLQQRVEWAAGQQILIAGVKGTVPSQVNGHRFIDVIDNGIVLDVRNVQAPPGWAWKGGGTVALQSHVVVPYSKWILQRFAARKRGASLNGVRGAKHHGRSNST